MTGETIREVDAFDLPEWLGTGSVTWTAVTSVHAGARVQGRLDGPGNTAATGTPLRCDLLAADEAYPRPVLDEQWRTRAHQAWALGQVLLIEYRGWGGGGQPSRGGGGQPSRGGGGQPSRGGGGQPSRGGGGQPSRGGGGQPGQLTLAVPGTGFTADRALEAIARLAKAVGATPDTFVAALRL